MAEHSGRDERLSVSADARGLVGHVGSALLRNCADRVGLMAALGKALPGGVGSGWRDRGVAPTTTAVAIVLGAANLSDALQLLAYQGALFGPPVSNSTVRRMLVVLDKAVLKKIASARARVWHHAWNQLAARPGGFPWLTIAGRRLTGWSDPASRRHAQSPRCTHHRSALLATTHRQGRRMCTGCEMIFRETPISAGQRHVRSELRPVGPPLACGNAGRSLIVSAGQAGS